MREVEVRGVKDEEVRDVKGEEVRDEEVEMAVDSELAECLLLWWYSHHAGGVRGGLRSSVAGAPWERRGGRQPHELSLPKS